MTTTANQTVTPGVAALSLTGFAPTVTVSDNIIVTPGVAALNLATFAPTVTASDNLVVTPGTLALLLSTFAPTVTVSGVAPAGGGHLRRRLAQTRRAPIEDEDELLEMGVL